MGEDSEPPFTPRDEPTRLDAIVLFAVPALLLVGIYLYPNSEQILEYKARNPTTVTIIGSNLAHRNFGHIAGNLVGFLLIGPLAFIFCSASRWKRLYYYVFGSYLVVLPFYSSSFAISLLGEYNLVSKFESVGFSLTIAALVAFLPIALDLFYRDNISDTPPALLSSAGLYLSGYTVVFLTLGATSPFIVLVTAVMGIVTITALLWFAHRTLQEPLHHSEGIRFLMAALFIFYAGLIYLFPPNVGSSFVGHMAGFTGGYVLPITGLSTYYVANYLHSKGNQLYKKSSG